MLPIIAIELNLEISFQIERCENSANSKRILLRDMLAVPMQRILKYHLLLQVSCSSYQKNFPDTP